MIVAVGTIYTFKKNFQEQMETALQYQGLCFSGRTTGNFFFKSIFPYEEQHFLYH